MLSVIDLKEGVRENMEQFLENLFLGMNSSERNVNLHCKGANIVQLDYVGSLNALQ